MVLGCCLSNLFSKSIYIHLNTYIFIQKMTLSNQTGGLILMTTAAAMVAAAMVLLVILL